MEFCNPNRIDLVVYHGKCGGDIEGNAFRGDAVFFAPDGEIASTFAEHVCMNGDVDYGYEDRGDGSFDEAAFLGSNAVVYKVRLKLENPAYLDAKLITKIANEAGVSAKKIGRFVEDFEDSCPVERKIVFAWVKSHGYDGAILAKDMMPVCAGGDSQWVPSYASFDPSTQVTFVLSEPEERLKESIGNRPRMRA